MGVYYMAFRDTARACFHFLKRHSAAILIPAALGLALWASTIAYNAAKDVEHDRKQGCENAELRANALHNILIESLKLNPNKESPSYIFISNELIKLPPVECDENGVLVPVGTNGQG